MSLATGSLTTLATAKAYVTPLPSDPVLAGLITRASMFVRSAINRPILIPKTYNEQFDGTGTTQLVLPHYPLLNTPTLTVTGVSIKIAPQANSPSPPNVPYGFRFQPWNGLPPGNPAVLELVGGAYYLFGRQNVVVSYKAGYQVTSEAQTIPATTFQITPQTPYGIWATDEGVTYAATGAALTPIASGTPAAGQYVPPQPDAATPIAYYQFAAADVGLGVLLNYGFVPSDIEQVVLEIIAERASYRQRVGLRSRSLASQESFTYMDEGLNKYVVDSLLPYVSVLPPAIGAAV